MTMEGTGEIEEREMIDHTTPEENDDGGSVKRMSLWNEHIAIRGLLTSLN